MFTKNLTTEFENTKDNIVGTFPFQNNLYSMNKDATCFKSPNGTCIDLLLTNKKYSFFNTKTFETGMSDHHKMIRQCYWYYYFRPVCTKHIDKL